MAAAVSVATVSVVLSVVEADLRVKGERRADGPNEESFRTKVGLVVAVVAAVVVVVGPRVESKAWTAMDE